MTNIADTVIALVQQAGREEAEVQHRLAQWREYPGSPKPSSRVPEGNWQLLAAVRLELWRRKEACGQGRGHDPGDDPEELRLIKAYLSACERLSGTRATIREHLG